MKITITNQSELPIYAQIREQIKAQIQDGTLAEGETLPSIRRLAREVGVSVITTTRAYSDLEQEGFIASMQGKGSVVLPQDNGILREQHLLHIEEHLEAAIRTARIIRLTREEFLHMADTLWEG